MIVQNEPTSAGGQAEISFTVPREDLRVARAALEPLAGSAFTELTTHEEMGKVSIVGAGMRSHPGRRREGVRRARRARASTSR